MNSYLLIFENEDFSVKDKLISCISPIRQEKMNRYLFDSDKKLSLFSELTLRMGLSNMLGCSPDYFRFESYKNGKPFITNEPNIYFNLSHTKNALLCSISTISNIGVDIEEIQSIDYTLFKYIAHPDEKRILQSSPNTQHDSLFYHFWTRKEAYCKRNGMGLRQMLSTVNTTTSEPENHFITWKTDNYICSIYCKCNDKNHIYMITEETIRKFFYRFL